MRLTSLLAGALAVAALLAGGSAASAGVLIAIDKSAQRMSVSVDGAHRYSWPVSTGKAGYATPAGSYTPFRMEVDHYSKEWDDAPMPHSIFFTKIGHAIHGSYETKRLGSPASHGCVRLSPQHAATLFALVKAEGLGNTKVVLSGTEPAAAPLVAKRAPRRQEGDPLAVSPDAYGARMPPSVYAGESDLDGYAARMRRRYQDERVVVRPSYEEPRYEQPRTYYRGGFPFGGGW